jgi:uncharacterized RDD family membrane protein YckC
MGVVYRARDLSLDRPVAIKVLADEVARSTDRRRRFYREARAQARLNHPNVGHLYFIGEQDGGVFFAMELIDGLSVADLLGERGKLPVGEAIDICRQAARGLAEAERAGVVHRDVKPSNLMLDRHGVVKVLDFGIAAEIDVAAGSAGAGEGAAEQTTLAGTPLYAAPEQVRGEAVDFRADIYALGVTLHQLITGEPPFRGDSPEELITQHESAERPRLSRKQLRREPTQIDGLIDRMMAKDPAGRFSSYAELVEAMEMVEPEVGTRAQLFPRAVATLIDAILWAIPLAVLEALELGVSALAWSTVWFAYQIIALSRYGATLGHGLMGLRVVAAGCARGVGPRRALARTVFLYGPFAAIAGASWIAGELGYREAASVIDIVDIVYFVAVAVAVAVAMFRSGGRAWWDRAAGTEIRTAIDRR